MFYCSYPGQWAALWIAKRHMGIHLSEHHLLVLIPGTLLGLARILLYGYTAPANFGNWKCTYFSHMVFTVTFTTVLIVNSTFAAEAYSKHAGLVLVVVCGTENIISLVITYSITLMTKIHSHTRAFVVLGWLVFGIFLPRSSNVLF